MTNLLAALQFLTAFPLKIKRLSDKNLAGSMVYFPIVGLFIGTILAGINLFLDYLGFADLSVNIILVVSLAAITGGLHLDGLSDTLDAFLSGKDKEGMLAIMRDPRAGVMALIGVVCAILLNIAMLSSIDPALKNKALLLAGLASRWSMTASITLFPYARSQGKAEAFFKGANTGIFELASLFAITAALLIWQLKGLCLLSLAVITACVIGMFSKKKIGGLTGDTLGAINETTQIISLFAVCLLERLTL